MAETVERIGYQRIDNDENANGRVRESPLTSVCPYILGNEFCERLAYYGLSTNLVVYFQEVLKKDTADASMQVCIWSGTCYITPILGAVVADSYLGRYKTILLFSTIYVIGLLCLVFTNLLYTRTYATYTQIGFALYLALYTISLGTGGIKPNVSSFGADQFDDRDPQDKKEKESFFNWFYMFINIGSLIASTFVVYIQQEISWTVGFAIPTVFMILAICIFVLGRRKYVRIKPAESPIARVFRVLFSALKHNLGISRKPSRKLSPMKKNISYAWLQSACEEESQELIVHDKKSGDFTKEQVEEVKLVIRLFPIFLTTCFYWCVYSQMQTFFVSQGLEMNPYMFKNFKIPAASLSSLDTISVIIFIPVYDRFLVPLLSSMGMRITVLQRIGIGLILASLAMIMAGIIEMIRLQYAHEGRITERGDVDFSIFWQTFQYVLIGASEVFTAIGQLELFYDQAPDSMRSCCSAMQLLSTAMGGYLAGFLIPAINVITSHLQGGAWIKKRLDEGRIDLYFFTLAVMNFANFLAFSYVAKGFEYKPVHNTVSSRPITKDSRVAGQAIPVVGRIREENFVPRSITTQNITPNILHC